ncbi:hypothetical protein JW711_01465 [Candidatus Woesearchaeota archaeon]|nr:hypothetical protein [Candidatus Woesearchaeota archaeon]
MAVEDDYELIPRQELEALRREIEKLKKNPLGDLPEGESLKESIDGLNTTLKKLLELFTNTEADLAHEYSEHNPVEELANVKEQNEQIANGILALADMIKEVKEDMQKHKEENLHHEGPDQFGQGFGENDSFGMPQKMDSNTPMPDKFPYSGMRPQQGGPMPPSPGMPPVGPDGLPPMPDFNTPPPPGMPPPPAAPPRKKGFFGR